MASPQRTVPRALRSPNATLPPKTGGDLRTILGLAHRDRLVALCHREVGGSFIASVMGVEEVPAHVARLEGRPADVYIGISRLAGSARAGGRRGDASSVRALTILPVDLDVKTAGMPTWASAWDAIRDLSAILGTTGGSGRPIVLIHGWPLSGESWQAQIPAFHAGGYRVVAYDRRGFGRSEKPLFSCTYDSLTEDLHAILERLDLRDVTLVGFSMGGGEVARYVAHYGTDRIRSIVLASAVTPYHLQTPTNPDGRLTAANAAKMTATFTSSKDAFLDQFMTALYRAGDSVVVSEDQRQESIAIAEQCDNSAALACMTAFANTDFRDDIAAISIPTLIIHGDSDAVPYEGSGKRAHEAIAGSRLHVIAGGPHGCNVSHTDEWNNTVLAFIAD